MDIETHSALNEIVDIFERSTSADCVRRTTRSDLVEVVRFALYEGRDLLAGIRLGLVSSLEAAYVVIDRLCRETAPMPSAETLLDAQEEVIENMRRVIEQLAQSSRT